MKLLAYLAVSFGGFICGSFCTWKVLKKKMKRMIPKTDLHNFYHELGRLIK